MSENKEKNIKSEGFSFILEDIFPNPFDTFRHSGESIKEAVKSGNIFIDTNVLLLPYSAGGSSIEASGSVYKKISNENRLYIPSQVIREYLKNRPKKVGELLQKLSDSISKFPKTPSISHPVLEGMREFDDLKQKIDEYTQLRKEIIDSQSKLHDAIVSWNLIDPVLDSYRKNIPDSAFVNCEATREDIINEVKTRYAQSIPPGYKDSSKDDGGIGDFIIWKTILEIGKKTQRSTIFVSGEEKSDWQYRSNNSSFLPRLELIDEYRRTSNGGSFFIIQLSELFSLLEVSTDTVEKIKLEEHRMNAINNPVVECPDCGVPNSVYLANFVGASATPSCKQCGSRFHVHRTGSGITIHSWGATSTLAGSQEQPVGDDLCSAQCPECESDITFELGLHQGSTRWFDCETCNARLSAHRKKNHDILLKSH